MQECPAGITWGELAIYFEVATVVDIPFADHAKSLHDNHCEKVALLGSRAQAMGKFSRRFSQLTGQTLWPGRKVDRWVNSLACLGFCGTSGLTSRCVIPGDANTSSAFQATLGRLANARAKKARLHATVPPSGTLPRSTA